MNKAELQEENEQLRAFARKVIFEYFEWKPTDYQCEWCLWTPARHWEPVHDCSMVKIAALLGEEKP